jgi:hypothetical protein
VPRPEHFVWPGVALGHAVSIDIDDAGRDVIGGFGAAAAAAGGSKRRMTLTTRSLAPMGPRVFEVDGILNASECEVAMAVSRTDVTFLFLDPPRERSAR